MYKIFSSKRANLIDSLGFGGLLPDSLTRHQEFWALRNVSLDMKRGDRVGLIGRNGAGKTTLLKLITGNLSPTEGRVEVNGRVQSLLEAGGGLHPEFTGLENIRAALTYQGLSPREIRLAEADIADFTELGDFLQRPFKTYSTGMQARLTFTLATTIKPEILIIDEMLGAGDAYFFGKSISRMQQLVESGASVVIVSHALDQIARFCDRTIWLDRGQVIASGSTLDVVKGYEKFVRVLEDRRLRGKNQKVRSNRFKGLQSEGYADTVIVRVTVEGPLGSWCDISEIGLLKGEELEDRLLVGSPQDADPSQSTHVVLEPGDWGHPSQNGERFFRRIAVPSATQAEQAQASGMVKILCWAFDDDEQYRAELFSRASVGSTVFLEVVRNGELLKSVNVPPSPDWTHSEFKVAAPDGGLLIPTKAAPENAGSHSGSDSPPTGQSAQSAAEEPARQRPEIANLSRWPGEGSLLIEEVKLLDGSGVNSAVFRAHEPMSIVVRVRSRTPGTFPLIMASLIFRLDGIVVTRHIGDTINLRLHGDELVEAALHLDRLNLGNGYYVLSVGLYRKLDPDDIEAPEIYDYLDRSYEFQVVGHPRMRNELFQHPGEWRVATITDDQIHSHLVNE